MNDKKRLTIEVVQETIETVLKKSDISVTDFYDQQDFNHFKSLCKHMTLVSEEFTIITDEIIEVNGEILTMKSSSTDDTHYLESMKKISSKYQAILPILSFFSHHEKLFHYLKYILEKEGK
jgi:enolase